MKKLLNNSEVKMKKLLLALFVMCSALSFSAKVIKSTNAEVKGDVVYEVGQSSAYTGIIETYNEKGVLATETTYKNSQQTGPAKIYDENGKLAVEFNLVNGKAEGLVKTYYPNGKIRTEENYKNDERDGLAKAYDENGKVVQQATFKNGKQVK